MKQQASLAEGYGEFFVLYLQLSWHLKLYQIKGYPRHCLTVYLRNYANLLSCQVLLPLLSQEPTGSSLTCAFSPQVLKEFQVIVEDRNDNAPVFQNTGFSTDISEVTSVLMVCVCGGGAGRGMQVRYPRSSSQSGKDQRQPTGIQDWEEHLLEGVVAGTKSRACNPMSNRYSNNRNSFNSKKK